VDNILASRLPRRLAERLARFCGITNDVRAGRLRREDRRQLVHTLTQLPLPVTGNRGWDLAEVTAGGVPLQEIDYRTMESRKCPGLYLAGEMLDCDGRVGGFNLQWAWSTGMIAGRAAARTFAP
jgi:predicted Rossmann fold flavoprotein